MSEKNEQEPDTINKALNMILIIGGVIATLIFIATIMVSGLQLETTDGVAANFALGTGRFGDSFGFATSLFTGLAFLGLFITTRLQRQELSIVRSERDDTRKLLENQTEKLEKDIKRNELRDLEDRFYRLLNLLEVKMSAAKISLENSHLNETPNWDAPHKLLELADANFAKCSVFFKVQHPKITEQNLGKIRETSGIHPDLGRLGSFTTITKLGDMIADLISLSGEADLFRQQDIAAFYSDLIATAILDEFSLALALHIFTKALNDGVAPKHLNYVIAPGNTQATIFHKMVQQGKRHHRLRMQEIRKDLKNKKRQ